MQLICGAETPHEITNKKSSHPDIQKDKASSKISTALLLFELV